MGRPSLAQSKDTKADLLQVGMEMIQTRGYNAFSYQDLSERLGIRKASIHYYFPSKEDLGISLMETGLERLRNWQASMESKDLSPTTLIESYFDFFATLSMEGARICPCGALVSEWGVLPDRLQQAVRKLLMTHRDWVKVVVERGRQTGEFSFQGTAEEQAQFVFASIQGALQVTRTLGEVDYFRAITRQVLNALKK